MAEKNLLENEELMKALSDCDSVEAIRETFANFDIKLADDVTDDAIQKIISNKDKELSDIELDQVTGGIALSVALGAVAVQALAAGEAGFICNYAYQKYKNWKKRR